MATRSVEAIPLQAETHLHPTERRSSNSSKIHFDCPSELEGLHVLVVDDEEDARRLVKTVLESCGAKVTTATNAAEALSVLQSSRPDVLISDLGMPDEDGHALIC